MRLYGNHNLSARASGYRVITRPSVFLGPSNPSTGCYIDGVESASTTPPEVVFHRYFQTSPRRSGMEHIKGKQDLSQLPEDLGTLLTDIQLAFNQSFALSLPSMAELGRSLALHLDYLESEKESAHAFESGGLHFHRHHHTAG